MRTTAGLAITMTMLLALTGGCKNRPEPNVTKQVKEVAPQPPEHWIKQLKAADASEREVAAQQLIRVPDMILKRYKTQLKAALDAESDPKVKDAIKRVHDMAATAP